MGEHSRPGPVDRGTGTLPVAGTLPSLALLLTGTALPSLLGRVETDAPHGGRD